MKVKRGDEVIHIRKVWGGFCWPGNSYGHCCVVGERLDPKLYLDRGYVHSLYYLDEFSCEMNDRSALLDAVVQFTEKFNVERWYGRGFNDKENHAYLREWNRGIKSRSAKRVSIHSALHSETPRIGYQLRILDTCLVEGDNILRWAGGSDFHKESSKIENTSWDDATCDMFPATASCGYVVSMLRALTQRSEPMFG